MCGKLYTVLQTWPDFVALPLDVGTALHILHKHTTTTVLCMYCVMYSVLHISILYARYADPSGRTQDKETFDPPWIIFLHGIFKQCGSREGKCIQQLGPKQENCAHGSHMARPWAHGISGISFTGARYRSLTHCLVLLALHLPRAILPLGYGEAKCLPQGGTKPKLRLCILTSGSRAVL